MNGSSVAALIAVYWAARNLSIIGLGLAPRSLCETLAFAQTSVSLAGFLFDQIIAKGCAVLNSIARSVSAQIKASYKMISMGIIVTTGRVRYLSELDC